MRKAFIFIGVAAIVAFGLDLIFRYSFVTKVHPKENESLVALIARRGEPKWVTRYNVENKAVYEVRFREVKIPIMNSEIPGYIFDSSGALLDWSSDPGEDREYQRRWRTTKGESVRVDDIIFSQ